MKSKRRNKNTKRTRHFSAPRSHRVLQGAAQRFFFSSCFVGVVLLGFGGGWGSIFLVLFFSVFFFFSSFFLLLSSSSSSSSWSFLLLGSGRLWGFFCLKTFTPMKGPPWSTAWKLQRSLWFEITMPIADPRNRQQFPRQDKAMLHCDLRARWEVASDLRSRVEHSEPELGSEIFVPVPAGGHFSSFWPPP